MKYQEALNYLRYRASESEFMIGVEKQNDSSYAILQELVDKATPKKLYTKANMTNKICPTCHLIFALDKYDRYEKHKYCPNCSQALDWSEHE